MGGASGGVKRRGHQFGSDRVGRGSKPVQATIGKVG
jgi:hypothetical protein